MVQIEGLSNVQRMLARSRRKYAEANTASVTVGFTQTYALIVHEDLNARHDVGQAKYLEDPLRTNARQIGETVVAGLALGASFTDALMLGGLLLQGLAQDLTPVDTGALKASAFTSPTENEEEAAKVAFEKSENLRLSVLQKRAKKNK